MKNFKKEIENLTEKIDEYRAMRDVVRDAILVECDFFEGEKVDVFEEIYAGQMIARGQGFIQNISVTLEGEYKYSVRKANTNGRPSADMFSKYDTIIVKKL